MKISDEIRELCDLNCGDYIHAEDCDELRALADRIDREMVELPKDRNGVPIHVGDTVYGCKNGYRYQVRALRLEDEWSISTNRGVFIDPSILTHTRPDSLRRIADELEEWSEDNRVNGSIDVFTRAADLADRIRKLAEKEGK